MKLKKKIFSVIIAVLMLANLVMPTMAQTITSNTFSGTVAFDGSTKQTADLSNIGIKIYSLAVAYTDPTSGQNDYSDTYVSTVTTNKNGAFSFTKPSVYYKIEIDLSSLPTGYGVDKYRCIYENGQSNDTFTLYPIHNAEMVMETVYDAPEVVFTASNGQRIYRDYEINLSNESTRSVSSPNVDILATTQATFAGNISGNEQYSFSKTFDLSKLSSLEKVGFYANTKMITEAEKIDKYCDIMIAKDFSEDGICLNHVIDEITDYAYDPSNLSGLSNSPEVAQVLSEPTTNDFPYSVENDYFVVRYDNTNLANHANTIATLLIANRRILLQMGFNDPTRVVNSNVTTKINVYVTNMVSSYGTGVYGTTTYDPISNTTVGHSYIQIYCVSTAFNCGILSEVVAHEYFHAVQNAHNYNSGVTTKWFKEACASWFAIYTGHSEMIKNDISNYLTYNLNMQLEYFNGINSGATYGKALFPLTIDIDFGGYSTIKTIYNILSSYSANYSNVDLRYAISSAVQTYNTSDSFLSVFKKFAINNSNPNYYYSSRIPYLDEEEGIQYDWSNNGIVSYLTDYAYSVYELGIKYFLIEPIGTNVQSFSGNITLSDTSNVAVTKSYKSASGTYTNYDLTINSNTYLLLETDLGSSTKKEIILVVMNTSLPVASPNNYDAHITVSVNGSLY